jgi:PAS domain S-box-containing protein
MTRLLFNQLHKERFAFTLNTTLKFVGGGILWVVLSDLALFVYNSSGADHFPLFHLGVLKGICFVIVMGIIFFIILQRHQNQNNEVDRQDFFRKNPLPMLIYSLDTMRFLEVNDAAVAVYGYSRKEFLSMAINDIRPAEELPRLRAAIEQLQSGCLLLGLWKHSRKDGSILHAEVTAYSILHKKQHAGLIISNDITKQMQAEEVLKNASHIYDRSVSEKTLELALLNQELQLRNREINTTNDELITLNKLLVDVNKKASYDFETLLRDKTEQLKRLLNQVSDCVWSFDLTGKDENYVSESALRFFNLSEEEVIDRPNFWMEFIHPEDIERVNYRLDVLEKARFSFFTFRIKETSGNYRLKTLSAHLIPDAEGIPVRFECTLRERNLVQVLT